MKLTSGRPEEPINEIPKIFGVYNKCRIKPFFPRRFAIDVGNVDPRSATLNSSRLINSGAVVKNIKVKCFLPYRRRREPSRQQINCWRRFKKYENCRGSSADTPFICYVYQPAHVPIPHVNKGKKLSRISNKKHRHACLPAGLRRREGDHSLDLLSGTTMCYHKSLQSNLQRKKVYFLMRPQTIPRIWLNTYVSHFVYN